MIHSLIVNSIMFKKTFQISLMLSFLFGGLFGLKAQDWANLKRYQTENEEIGLPAKNEKRVVFMGNSITEGWKKANPDFFSENSYICRGISGQTTPQMLIRFRQDVVDLKPKAVVILAGTNDIAGNTGPSTLEMIMDNLKSMAEIADENDIEVILCSVLPVKQYRWKPEIAATQKVVDLNAMIKAYCKKKGFFYLDYFSAMATDENFMIPEYTTDEVHVTPAGYAVMEEMVRKAIKKVL